MYNFRKEKNRRTVIGKNDVPNSRAILFRNAYKQQAGHQVSQTY